MTEKAKGGAYSVWTRIIAILLAVTLLAGIVVYQQTNVAVNPEPWRTRPSVWRQIIQWIWMIRESHQM